MDAHTSPAPTARFVAEAAGVFILTATLMVGRLVAGSALETALLFGLVWGLVLLLLGSWSDQFNPAVSLWKFLTRQIDAAAALVAILGQFVGAFLGVWVVKAFLDMLQVPSTAVLPQVNQSLVDHPNLGWIVALTEGAAVLFVLVGYLIAKQRATEDRQALVVGLSVVPAVLVSSVFSGAVINFAAFVAVLAVYHQKLAYWWGYLVGPILAIIVAALIMMIVDKTRKS